MRSLFAVLLALWASPFIVRSQSAVSAAAGQFGMLQVGNRGISETTAQIEARERLAGLRASQSKKVPPRLLAPFQGNGAEKSASHSPLHHPPISRLNAQTINSNLNFTAATFPDCSGWPPDTMGTVGPTQFIIALNGRIRSFNKTTGLADNGINA